MTTCKCGALAEYSEPFNPYSPDYCSSCFLGYIEKKVLKGVPRSAKGHPIAVAVSGGKDSLVLLTILHAYQDELKLPLLIAIVLEEEIPEVQQERQMTIQYMQNQFPRLPIYNVSYSELFGHNLPTIVFENDKNTLGYTPCSICGIFRRQALFELGKRYSVDFIALGTTLEDEAATMILNTIRGLSPSVQYDRSNSDVKISQRLPQRIKPLARIHEDLIRAYVKIKRIPTVSTTCPYAQRSLRSEITSFFTSLKSRDKQGSFLFNILKSQKESENKTIPQQQTYTCERCQMISHNILCPSCRILSKIFNSD
jgi:uncharacterized protein (TIGR00269 family)